MKKTKSIFLWSVLILSFINIFADTLPKQSFKGQLVIVQELKINQDTVRLGVSSEGQLLRYDGSKWTNWTPNFDSLYSVDSVKYLRKRIQIYQNGSIDSTEVLIVDTTQVLNLQQFIENHSMNQETDPIYSGDSALLKTTSREWDSSVAKLIKSEDTVYWNSKLDVEIDPIYEIDSSFIKNSVRSYVNDSSQTLHWTDTAYNDGIATKTDLLLIEPPVGGFANNLYLTNTNSTILGYKNLSYTPEENETIISTNVTLIEGEKLVQNYLYTMPVATELFPSGLWSFNFYANVNATAGITEIGVSYYKRNANIETNLFTLWSGEINNTLSDYISFQVTNPSFIVSSTDTMGVKVYIRTTTTTSKTVSYRVGDGYGAYLNNPNKIRHSQLRALNGDLNYLHVTSSDTSIWNNQISQTITNGVTTKAPSEDAVFDAFAKLNNISMFSTDTIHYVALGNSITYGAGSFNQKTSYVFYLDSLANFESVTNLSVGGAVVMPFSTNAQLITQVQNIPTNANLITVAIGTNDIGVLNPIGSLLSIANNNSNFTNALYQSLLNIKTNHPRALIYFITPLKTTWTQSGSIPTPDDYLLAIRFVCNKLSIPIIDAYSEFDLLNPADHTDGLHPNDVGYKRLGAYVYSKIFNQSTTSAFTDQNRSYIEYGTGGAQRLSITGLKGSTNPSIGLYDKTNSLLFSMDTLGNSTFGALISPTSKLVVSSSYGGVPSVGVGTLALNSTQAAGVGVGSSIVFRGKTGNGSPEYQFAGIRGVKSSSTANDYSGDLVFMYQNASGSSDLTEGAILKSTGFFGIGKTNPLEMLDVNGNIQGVTNFKSSSNNIILSDAGGAVFRGVVANAWLDNTPSRFFQIGSSNTNVVFTTQSGVLANRFMFSATSTQITNDGYDGAIVPTGIFEVANTTTALFNVLTSGNVGIGTTAPTAKLSISEKSAMNEIGGQMIKLTNKTGANSVKGTIVAASSTTDNAFMVNPISGDMPIGVVWDAGIADGAECWVVVGGVAEILAVNAVATTRGYIAYSSTTVAGRMDIAATVPAAATHFTEIGHTNESKTAGTNVLVKCVIHFN